VVAENMIHKTENVTQRTHISFHNHFVMKNNMKVG